MNGRMTLLWLIGLFFAILFFVSDASQKDLATINALTALTAYNCDTVYTILNKDTDNSISYSYYATDPFLQNLGFVYDKYGFGSGNVTRSVIYDMVYSNRLLDGIVRLNAPTGYPNETMQTIINMKNQVKAFAVQINNTVKCPGQK